MMLPCVILRALMFRLDVRLNETQYVNDGARTPADSTLAAYCNDRDSAHPAGSYRKIMPIFGVRGRGVTAALANAVVKDLLQLLTAGPGTSRHFAAARQSGRIWREADINSGNHRAGFYEHTP